MTFEDWKAEADHFFEWLKYDDLWQLPQWKIWVEKMDLTLRSMRPESARDTSFDKLIEIAGIKNEIELVKKQEKVKRKLDEINEDFN